ncbi:MAG: electron transfer flavoprotein subunit beta/FixA family protein, partial [Desulfobacterales bacterium]|nr:electron transfer flavoprotein subunit beta/FixA family protein [Desulfobacterales bacterium]
MGIQIIVCIKSIIANGLNERVIRSSDPRELNPYDRPVLEVALRIREELGGTITALSMGPEPCAFTLNEAMAMGVDRGVLLNDPALAGADTLATSNALAAAIKKLAPFDLVLFGTRAADSDTGQVGPQTAV